MPRGPFLFCLLMAPFLWIASWWLFDLVRVLAGLLLIALVALPRLRTMTAPELKTGGRIAVGVFAVAWFALLIAHMAARLELGLQGIDFAIFSQVIDSIARRGAPTGSLAISSSPNFLWHHFCAVLFVPGALAALGMRAPYAAIVFHAVGASVGFAALFATARKMVGETFAAAVVIATMLASSVRPELFWGIHDETFAIAFVGLGLFFWLGGKFELAALSVALTCTCKESFFLFAAWFAVLAIWFHRDFHDVSLRPRAIRAFVALVPIGVVATVLYFFMQPMLLGKTFDHLDKLATREILLSPQIWFDKALYVASVLIGSFGLGLFSRKGRIVLAMALPLVSLVMISGYAEMWRPFGYYTLVPSVIAMFAAVVSVQSLRLNVSAPAQVLLVLSALCFATNLPLRDVFRASREASGFSAESLAWVPADARVIVDPGAALALLHVKDLRRLAFADGAAPSSFDFVVLRPGGWEPLPPSLLESTIPCHPSGAWEVRCPR